MKLILQTIMLVIITNVIHAQTIESVPSKSKFGVKFSTGVLSVEKESINFMNTTDGSRQNLVFTGSSPFYSVGFWGQKKFGWLYTDANVQYATYGTNYDYNGSTNDQVFLQSIEEKHQYLDLQIMGGLTANGFRLGVGPMAHILLAQKSDLAADRGFNVQDRKISYGFSAGIGYDIKRFSFDIKFDKAFRTIGDHMYYGTTKTKFKETPDVWAISVAYQLF